MNQPRYSTAVSSAVISAYYARALNAADSARARAQQGFAIATFVASGLVGVSAISDFDTLPLVLRGLGLLTFAAWVRSALLYGRAVSEHIPLETSTQRTADDLVDAVMANVALERERIDSYRVRAQGSVKQAALVSVVLIIGILLLSSPSKVRIEVELTDAGAQSVGAFCSVGTDALEGESDVGRLENHFVALRVLAGPCRGKSLYVRQDHIAAIERE